jgi:two-component system nitrate/nitrite sensor histidine kinase NarX
MPQPTIVPLIHSILLRVGVAIVAIALLGIASNIVNLLITEKSRGRASAINLAGSLRMLSQRISTQTLIHAPIADINANIVDMAARRDKVRALTTPLPFFPDFFANRAPIEEPLKEVDRAWDDEFLPVVRAYLAQRQNGDNTPINEHALIVAEGSWILVDKINALVLALEEDLERNINVLRLVLLLALMMGGVMVVYTIALMKRQVVEPIHHLLEVANAVHHGQWGARVNISKRYERDEIGTLSKLFNDMFERLADLYTHLEEKVREKTQDLALTTQRLQILYQSSQLLSQTPLSTAAPSDLVLQKWVNGLKESLPLDDIGVCLYQHSNERASVQYMASNALQAQCQEKNCGVCHHHSAPPKASAENNIKEIPLYFQNSVLGYLIYQPDRARWQDSDEQLLQALAQNLSLALERQMQIQDRNRLAIHDERTVLARELHDSLAQELVYLKMQTGVMEAQLKALSIEQAEKTEPLNAIVRVVRDRLTHAIQELRELIATFRLSNGEGNLMQSLLQMKNEFWQRASLTVHVDVQLEVFLNGEQENHVLRIIREALINVTKHAHAQNAKVLLCREEGSPTEITLWIEDDGQGITIDLAEVAPKSQHFGMNIMRERARNLGGQMSVQSAPGKGTKIRVSFPMNNKENHE